MESNIRMLSAIKYFCNSSLLLAVLTMASEEVKVKLEEVCNFDTGSKSILNFKRCILCQEVDNKKSVVDKPRIASYEKIVIKSKFWSDQKDGKFQRKMCDAVAAETSVSLSKQKAFWHRECYSWYTNTTLENRTSRKRVKCENVEAAAESVDVCSSSKRSTRSSFALYDKNRCFFCQIDDASVPLYNLRSFQRSNLVCKAIEITGNEVLRIRFSSALDGHAGDMKYHAICMITNVDNVLSAADTKKQDVFVCDGRIYAAQQEILMEVENGIRTGSCYSMKNVTLSYIDICQQLGYVDDRKELSIRKNLKTLFQQEIDGVEFRQSARKNESEMVYSSLYNSKIMDASIKQMLADQKSNLGKIMEVAKIIRGTLLGHTSSLKDVFKVSEPFSKGDIPLELASLIRWILHGGALLDGSRRNVLDNETESLCNTLIRNIKTQRQMTYEPKDQEIAMFRSRVETNQSIGLALAVRMFGRQKSLVDILSKFGFIIDNKLCLRYETALANEVLMKMALDGCFIPANAKKSNIVQFHLDNCDFLEDGPTGKVTTHVLLLVGSQYSAERSFTSEPMEISPSKSLTLISNNFNALENCKKPSKADVVPSKSWKNFTCHGTKGLNKVTLSGYIHPWIVARSIANNAKIYKDELQLRLAIDFNQEIPIELQDTELTEHDNHSQANSVSLHDGSSSSVDIERIDVDNEMIEERENDSASEYPIHVGRPLKVKVLETTKYTPKLSETILSKLADVESLTLPTYSGYNAELMKSGSPDIEIANILMFPLIPGPASSYSAIYTSLKLAQSITTHVAYGSTKTIITLDLDLYERALQLRNSRDDLRDKFILRLGELHIVFAQCRAIGAFIENTGVDDAWIRSEVVGPNTVKQVLTCSHMKRALIVHEATVLALYQRYYDAVSCEFPQFFENVIMLVINLNKALESKDYRSISILHAQLTKVLEGEMLSGLLLDFEKERMSNYQLQLVKIYMRMFERLLLFIHATRSRNWALHLSSTEALIQDLESADRIKYGRLLPVYIAEMHALERSDPVVWKAFTNGEFAVQKTKIPFVALGMDHAGEQVNKLLKINGGLVGVSKNVNARNRFMITAPIIAEIATKAKQRCGLKTEKTEHHQLSKAYVQLQHDMVDRFNGIFESVNLNFHDKSDTSMRNFITNKVFSDDIIRDVLEFEQTGKKRYEKIVQERLKGDTDLFSTLPKLQLKLPRDGIKKVKAKIDGVLEDIKGYSNFFGRCAIVANQRDIDMKSIIGNYELDVVPRSVMTADGMLHPGDEDKSKIVEILTDGYSKKYTVTAIPSNKPKVAIFDAMVIVQKISALEKNKQITVKWGKDIADHFVKTILALSEGYEEIRVVFDHYKEDSLKQTTRESRGNSLLPHFLVSDTTPINTSLEKFLIGIKTKQELTEYLASKCERAFKEISVRYLISVSTRTFGNIECDQSHNHEEADTLMIWHAIHASKRKVNIVVFSPDTDVFCMLLAFKSKIKRDIYMQTSHHIISIGAVYRRLGPLKSIALLCLHALSGCDTCGRLLGKRKTSWMSIFMECSRKELEALISLQTDEPLSQINVLEELVCKLYCKTKSVKTLASARYHLFQQNGHQAGKLPPTSATFKQATLRAHYQLKVWTLSEVAMQNLPNPSDCGWYTMDGKTYMAKTYDAKIAPDDIMLLIKCNCSGKCNNGRCSCFKAKLSCTDLCHPKCSSECENIDHRRFSVEQDLTDDKELFESMTA